MILGLLSVFLEKKVPVISGTSYNYFYLLFCGFMMSVGIIVPGVSSTIILMLLGVYSSYLTSVSSLYMPILIPIAIGLVLGSLVFMRVTKYCLDHFYAETFYTIIGFTLGSILVIWPDFTPDLSGVFSFLCMMIGPIFAIMKK